MSDILHCPNCGHHINIAPGETAGYCPICDKEVPKMGLRPCPFCGGEAKLKHGFPRQQRSGIYQTLIQCKDCGCRTLVFRQLAYESRQDVDKQAVTTWNRRK